MIHAIISHVKEPEFFVPVLVFAALLFLAISEHARPSSKK
jgi:hypothetical protein